MKFLMSATFNQCYGSATERQGLGSWPPVEVGCDLDFESMSEI